MLTGGKKQLPQIDNTNAIQFQGSNRCTTDWCQAYDEGAILIPGEMFSPRLATRVKEQDAFFRQWIKRSSLGVFVAVTSLTGQRQIVGGCFSTFVYGDNMFNGERGNRV